VYREFSELEGPVHGRRSEEANLLYPVHPGMQIEKTSIRATRRTEDPFAFGKGCIQAVSPAYFPHSKNILKLT
ncbi:MAG: hypothetical protein J0H57_19920, partial [Rhodospirillales bacterium]|nr:hypothetical protein [Rhodospirillales bacterium]